MGSRLRALATLRNVGVLCFVVGVVLLGVGGVGWYDDHHSTTDVCLRGDHGHGRCNGRPNPWTWGPAGLAFAVLGVGLVGVSVRRRRGVGER